MKKEKTNKKEKESEERFLNLCEKIDKTIDRFSEKNKHLTYGEIILSLGCLKERLESESKE